jgi:hypothetical protein
MDAYVDNCGPSHEHLGRNGRDGAIGAERLGHVFAAWPSESIIGSGIVTPDRTFREREVRLMSGNPDIPQTFDRAAREVVDLGNRLLQDDDEVEIQDVASGLLAGAVHFWLYANQPCGEPTCAACAPIDTAEKRLDVLLEECGDLAQGSDYYHSPQDSNVGRA